MKERESKIWSIKYAPKDISESKVNLGKKFDKLVNMDGIQQHMIFSGMQGSGKTTFAELLAKKHLTHTAESVKVITAETSLSKEEKKQVKKIRKGRLGSSGGRLYGLPKFLHARAINFVASRPIMTKNKVLIIREFHEMRNQESFRRVMENYPYCKMILITHSLSAILSPIASRCIKIGFGKIKFADFLSELKRVEEGENITVPLKVAKMLYSTFNGNIGSSINAIQFTHLSKEEITKDSVAKSIEKYKRPSVIPLLQSAFDRSLARTKKDLDGLLYKMNPMEIYSSINDEVIYQDLDGLGDILMYLARNERKLMEGNDQRVQLLNILMHI